MDKILEIENLTKIYTKDKTALNNVSISIDKGQIIGLLGPNGGGKTTLIKSIVGLLKPTKGNIKINGQNPGVYTKSIVSYLPDLDYIPKWMSVRDAMLFFQDFYNDFNMEKSKKLIDFMELDEKDKVAQYSKGMTEKLQLALVLSREAKLYILDEPIAGVDPVTREKILDAIVEFYTEDSSMIITTHLISDIERIFDKVAFINNGEIKLYEDAETLRTKFSKSIDEIYREVFK